MTAKSANLYAKIEPEMPPAKSIDMSTLVEEQMNVELEKGYADMKCGRTKPAKKVFADIRKD